MKSDTLQTTGDLITDDSVKVRQISFLLAVDFARRIFQ